MKQLTLLCKPFPDGWIEQPSQGKHGTYVKHQNYEQKLLLTLGSYDWRIVQVVKGVDGQIEGCVGEITVFIDGRLTTVQEAGDCEHPENWKTQGARLKDASSDAFKRCCMRLGLGLHLWAQNKYVLFKELEKLDQS